ncbi:MAG TPA: 4-carboxymuconolactone decarboxylase [Actinocrinis sp.]|nr:4-carboxymuconolactone decarboxylase [Actinocrinis sp.]
MTDRPLLHYRRDGRDQGDGAQPPLILGPSIGTSTRLWDEVIPALAADRTVIRYDLPGHGGTPSNVLPSLEPGAMTIADLAQMVLNLANALGIKRFSYAGVSLGGAIGTWLAIHRPERIASLAIVCSSARFGDPRYWQARAKLVRDEGTGPVADAASVRWFAEGFAASGAPIAKALLDDLRGADPSGYAACCDVIAGLDLRDQLGAITAPTLVIAGCEDVSAPLAHSRELAGSIPAATLLELPDTGHLAPVEQPRIVADALRSHFAATPNANADGGRRDAGMAVRRAVLGDAHVDRAIANTSAFTADFQDFITRYAWGEIWTRPGLDRRIRSAVTLTALVAHGHLNELAMHLRGALNNGLSRAEIGEILLQTAVYCGVPAANAAFAVAQQVFAELDDSGHTESKA